MKNFKKVTYPAALVFILYLIFAFAAWDFNPGGWALFLRVVFSFTSLFASFVLVAFLTLVDE